MAEIGLENKDPLFDSMDGLTDNDKIIGSALAFGDEQEALGIVNKNTIDTDGGKAIGIFNGVEGVVETGDGDDVIHAEAEAVSTGRTAEA